MNSNLKILFVEDVPSDLELIKREIKKSGIEFVDQVVEIREEYIDALMTFKPDIILSDYTLPQFDGMQALLIRQKEAPSIPFILVTGALNEETAVKVMKAGSDDYILKQNLTRLSSAIESAINKWKVIEAKKQAEESLKSSEELLNRTNAIAKIGGWEIDLLTMKTFMTKQTYHIYGIDPSKPPPSIEAAIKFYAFEARPIIKAAVKAAIEHGTSYELELPFITAKGQHIWIHTKGEPVIEDGKITKLTGTFQDITERKQAEDKIAQLSQAVEQSPVSIVITNLKGEIEYTNPKYTEVTGFLPEEALGNHPRILKREESSSHDYKELWTTITSGNEWRGEFHNQKKDGEHFWEFASISSIKNKEGKLTHFIAVKEDITERKHAEEQLRESEKRYRRLIETTSEGFWLLNNENETIDVNESLCSMLGYFRDEIIGKTPFSFANNASKEVFKKQILESKTTQHRNYEVFLTKKSGDSFPAIFNATTLFDDIGERVGSFAFITDISERKKAEELLKSSEERLKILFESAPDTYFLTDLKGTLVDGNKAAEELFGYKREEFVGKSFFKLNILSKSDIPKASENLHKSALGHGTGPDEFMLIHRGGRQISVEIRTYPVQVEKRTVILAIARDITKRKQAELALAESEQQYRRFFEKNISGVYLSTPQGKLVDCNPAFTNMLGYSREEMLEMDTKLLYPHSTIRNEFLHKLTSEKSLLEFDIDFVCKDGEVINCIENVVGIFNKKGELEQFQGYVVDVTDRKKAEEKIIKLSQALEQSPASIVITNLKGEIEYTNPKFTEVTGYSAQEALGKNPRILKSYETNTEEYKQLWETITSGNEWRGEFHNKKKSGELYWENASISPIRNNESKITHFLAVKEDITKSKKAEQSLKESEAKYRSLIEHSNDAIYLLYKRKFEIVNNQFFKMFGYTREEINRADIDFMQFVAPKSKSLIEKRQKKFAKGEDLSSKYEFTAVTKNGKEIEVETSVSFIEFKDGKATQGIIRDITDRKKRQEILMNAILKVQEEEKNKFGKELHDGLGQVLTSASMYIESIRKIKDELPGNKMRDLEMAHKLNKQAIVDARKISHGLMVTGINEYGIKHLIKQICENSSTPELLILFEHKNVDEEKINSEAKIHLYRIVQELSVNILKHSGASKAKICLSISNTNKLKLTVSDNGIGFDLKQITYGAGLHNVMYRNTILNGKIDISSTGVKGTKVTIAVPLQL